MNGESIVKVASYQSRSRLYDEREDVIYDFSHKKDLVFTEIFLPSNAPTDFSNRCILWNAVDKVEKRYDARTGRAVIIALQNELALKEQIESLREFVIEAFVKRGMCADVAIHSGHRENCFLIGDDAPCFPSNPHAHILLTDRPINHEGFCSKKNRDWNKEIYVRQWREVWEKTQNKEFERKGLAVRISHESLEVQGIERAPTKHLGLKIAEMKRRGKETNRDYENRAIEALNKELNSQKHQRQLMREQEHEMSR